MGLFDIFGLHSWVVFGQSGLEYWYSAMSMSMTMIYDDRSVSCSVYCMK